MCVVKPSFKKEKAIPKSGESIPKSGESIPIEILGLISTVHIILLYFSLLFLLA